MTRLHIKKVIEITSTRFRCVTIARGGMEWFM